MRTSKKVGCEKTCVECGRHKSLSSLGLGLHSTPQVYAYANSVTVVDPVQVDGEEGQLRDCPCQHTQRTMPVISSRPLTRGTQGACPSQQGQRSFTTSDRD
ncbi:hypothetical protein THAOC_23173 [Thalassiosira oceanica]|uniref:Uncharacterized protein n=1 Tax=Thalassiosira oceanica TaxID=159749 RepID=K0RSQ7_THAOC|nr:hypothetical protein THAOC_23173 [Thalassiosira oceanica]|eukprot:EJK56853.1 hypothetical protein THAOC_23173 [Thalassiosira oceanica]